MSEQIDLRRDREPETGPANIAKGLLSASEPIFAAGARLTFAMKFSKKVAVQSDGYLIPNSDQKQNYVSEAVKSLFVLCAGSNALKAR